jgi:hypothetical protein
MMDIDQQSGPLKECRDFFQLVLKELEFLLEDGGFTPVKLDSARQGERCLVILASLDYQLKLIADRGTLESLIGSSEAARGWENIIDGNVEWYGLYNFIEVALDNHRSSPDEWRELGYRLFNMSLNAKMQEVAKLLAPIYRELTYIFHEGRLAEIKHELE